MRLKITRVKRLNGHEREIRSIQAFGSRKFVPFDRPMEPGEEELYTIEGFPEDSEKLRKAMEVWKLKIDDPTPLEPFYQEMREIRSSNVSLDVIQPSTSAK